MRAAPDLSDPAELRRYLMKIVNDKMAAVPEALEDAVQETISHLLRDPPVVMNATFLRRRVFWHYVVQQRKERVRAVNRYWQGIKCRSYDPAVIVEQREILEAVRRQLPTAIHAEVYDLLLDNRKPHALARGLGLSLTQFNAVRYDIRLIALTECAR